MESGSDAGKISYVAVRETLGPMYLVLVSNDTVPISLWRGGGMRDTECPLVHYDYITISLSVRLIVSRLQNKVCTA